MSKRGNTTTVNAVSSIPATQLKDDVEALLTANGFNLNDLTRLEKQQDYRREYSQRVEVKSKRKLYSQQRYQKMLRELLAQRVVGE